MIMHMGPAGPSYYARNHNHNLFSTNRSSPTPVQSQSSPSPVLVLDTAFSIEESTDGPEEGFYEECASGRDFILVMTHFPMGVMLSSGQVKWLGESVARHPLPHQYSNNKASCARLPVWVYSCNMMPSS